MSSSPTSSASTLRKRLAAALPLAMKRRDRVAVSALRSALAAIADAEAVPTGDSATPSAVSEHVAGAASGLRAAEVARLALTERDVVEIVATEAREREAAALEYDEHGAGPRAERLRAEAGVLWEILNAD